MFLAFILVVSKISLDVPFRLCFIMCFLRTEQQTHVQRIIVVSQQVCNVSLRNQDNPFVVLFNTSLHVPEQTDVHC